MEERPTNFWQQQAVPPKPPAASQEEQRIRSARDAYADKVIGVGRPIEQLLENHIGYTNPPRRIATGSSSIIAPFPNETVVAGTFDSFDVVLTPTHQAIYTEIHIGVDRVVFSSETSWPAGVIDVIEPGGNAALPDGKTISYKTAPRAYGLVPQGRYLLFLRHAQPGNFYLLYDSISINNGLAKPNSPDAERAAANGKWAFSNLSESELVSAVARRLDAQHPDR